MDYVTANLTPGRYFYNFQIQKVMKLLDNIQFTDVTEFNDFYIFRRKNIEKIKIRKDGSIYYTTVMDDLNEFSVNDFLARINEIANKLNPAYEGLLNDSKIYIYWPENYKNENRDLSKYFTNTENIFNNQYASIVNRDLQINC